MLRAVVVLVECPKAYLLAERNTSLWELHVAGVVVVVQAWDSGQDQVAAAASPRSDEVLGVFMVIFDTERRLLMKQCCGRCRSRCVIIVRFEVFSIHTESVTTGKMVSAVHNERYYW